ncbi:MAG TPA: IPExxxVDY family protein [Flavobacterium sp.]|jgi:hypothetical protein|nr:IPExxxVDY family protein [Flavobacterium sp.]
MAVHKLHLDEFDEIDYQLVAIHTSLEDYRLAYYINQQLSIKLGKSRDEIQIKNNDGITYFGRYIFECADTNANWNLIQNQGEVIHRDSSELPNLFAPNLEIATKVYLLPEFKKVNYFLKIENTVQTTTEIITAINNIARISTVYEVDIKKIKSKNNLIF